MSAGGPGSVPVDPEGDHLVDAHMHVWDLARSPYPWMAQEPSRIRRTFTRDDVRPELAAAGVGATILVQADDTVADTELMIEAARRDPGIVGVVAWLPLTRPREAERLLESWGDQAAIVGIRHLVHREPDPRWLCGADVSVGLELLADRGLPFEVCAESLPLLALVPEVARAHPTLTLVLDHLGKPPIRTGGWQPWADLLRDAAALPNVVAKVSGLNTAAGERYIASAVRPYVEHAFAEFGCDRLMYGGDWPYALLAADSYTDVWRVLREVLNDLAPDDRRQVLGETARRVYRLPVSVGPAHRLQP